MDLKSGLGEQPASQDQVAPLFCRSAVRLSDSLAAITPSGCQRFVLPQP